MVDDRAADRFPLAALVSLAKPLGNAKDLRRGVLQSGDRDRAKLFYPWPDVEDSTIAEAASVVGLRGHRRLWQAGHELDGRARPVPDLP